MNKNEQLTNYLREENNGAFSGKMLLVRIIENNKIYTYFRSGQVK